MALVLSAITRGKCETYVQYKTCLFPDNWARLEFEVGRQVDIH